MVRQVEGNSCGGVCVGVMRLPDLRVRPWVRLVMSELLVISGLLIISVLLVISGALLVFSVWLVSKNSCEFLRAVMAVERLPDI